MANVVQVGGSKIVQVSQDTTTVDSDYDGLSDDMEKKLGTDPHNPDTDDDGLSDGFEVFISKTNPLDPKSF